MERNATRVGEMLVVWAMWTWSAPTAAMGRCGCMCAAGRRARRAAAAAGRCGPTASGPWSWRTCRRSAAVCAWCDASGGGAARTRAARRARSPGRTRASPQSARRSRRVPGAGRLGAPVGAPRSPISPLSWAAVVTG